MKGRHIAFADCLISELDPHGHPLPFLQTESFGGVLDLDTVIQLICDTCAPEHPLGLRSDSFGQSIRIDQAPTM